MVQFRKPISFSGANVASDTRNNLGLGDSATKNVGTAAGTVAAGDHSHSLTGDVTGSGSSSIPTTIAAKKAWRGHRHGIAVSNNSTDPNNDIDFGVGSIWDNTNDVLIDLTSGLTKRLDASWAVGNNQGGLFSGTKANSTWYHAFLIRRSDTGVVDAGFDTSVSAANRPANYDQFRRRFSILTDGSGNIRAFFQWGDYILWKTPIVDQNGITVGTTASLLTLSVPPGVRVQPLLSVATGLKAAAAPGIYFSSPDVTDVAASFPGAMTTGANGTGQSTATTGLGEIVISNTSSQIRARCTDASTTAWVATQGWYDPAGRFE